ncbi:MAG: hypothetical protein GEU88_03425 [Solirubrobacterales bacterium]|nr:hypothetical protein [Solirubrobacterales bacterium]
MTAAERVLVVGADDGPELPLIAEGGTARAVIWPGMGAALRSMHLLSLRPGGRTRRLRHPGEAVYYVIEGAGRVVDADLERGEQLVEGSMVHVDGATAYELHAGDAGMELVGGPSPADPVLYESRAAAG